MDKAYDRCSRFLFTLGLVLYATKALWFSERRPYVLCIDLYTGYTQKNGAVSKVNKKFISHLTRAQRTSSAAATVQVSLALITVLRCVHPGSHGRAAKGDNHLLPWPPRSPDLTQCDFFLWGFVKYSVYVPPLPMSLKEFRGRITHALQTITADMLQRVWDEFDYRMDVCRVTQGTHIEGL